MRLHYLVKLRICVFCENSNAGNAKLKKLLIDFDFTYLKRCNFDCDITLWQI